MDSATGADLARVPANESLSGDGPVGICVLDLRPGRALQACIARGCDLVLLGVAGSARLGSGVVLHAGRLVVWPRGAPLTVEGLSGGCRVCVVAVPPGPEQVLAALSRADLPAGSLVALAADSGVELLLP